MTTTDYQRIEKAIQYIASHYQQQPSLDTVAAAVCLSPYHFQRLFKRWAGISPKRFLQYLTAEHAKQLLHHSKNILDATYDVGLTSTSRLHDLMINMHGVTPGEWKTFGTGLVIYYGIHPSPFGDCLIATTERGVCSVAFIDPGTNKQEIAELQTQWPQAILKQEPGKTILMANDIFKKDHGRNKPTINLFVKGSNFQLKVWEALLRIPPGMVISYENVAEYINAPMAARAVGSAIAKNPVALLIPCHRVIKKTGVLGKYRWGDTRKSAILGWEIAKYGD